MYAIKKYEKIILLFDKNKQPQGLLEGFNFFCKKNNLGNEIVDSLDHRKPIAGEIFVIPEDRGLIIIIKKIKKEGLILSEDIGIISYNDTLLKEIVEGGITTISTDFKEMGKRLAQMIMNKENVKIENPANLMIRKSL